MTDVLTAIEEISAAPRREEIWACAARFFAAFGFSRINYGYTRSHLRLESTGVEALEDALFLTTCDAAFVSRYLRSGRFARSAQVHWAETHTGACTWAWISRAARMGGLTAVEMAAAQESRRLGVTSGITISFPAASRRAKGALGLIADPGLDDDAVERIWAQHGHAINAVAQIMHFKLIQFPISGRARSLTVRQREVLEWVADGKTTMDVAQILNISGAMVEKHLRLAREVLNVDTTVQAVAKAAMQNLIFARPAAETSLPAAAA